MTTTTINIPELLIKAAHAKTPSSRRNRKYALVCLRQYLATDLWPISQFTRDVVEEFTFWLVKSGKSTSTVELYRKELRTILTDAYPAFEEPIRELFQRPRAQWHQRKEGLGIESLRQLARLEFGPLVQWTRARDLFLVALYCGGADFDTLVSLTRSDVSDGYLHLPGGLSVRLNANLQSLLDEYQVDDDPTLFPFAQRWTEERYREVLRQIANRYHFRALQQRDSAVKAWISLARKLRVDFPVMYACAARPLGILDGYTPTGETVSQAAIDSALTKVSSAVADMTEHWYAMRLRSGRTTEDIYQRIQEHPEHAVLRSLVTYYPCEDIVRRVGNKFLKQAKAYIEHVLFFRTRPVHVGEVFQLTSDLGWIYRQVNSVSSPYAVIPQHEMSNFQAAIARFTPDIEVSLVKTEEVTVGRRVRLLAGDFAGCEGIILDVASPEEVVTDLREFVVAFTTENALKIKLNILESDVELLAD